MFFRHSTDWLIYPLIVFGILVFLSYRAYRPKYHLRTEMPAAFYSETGATGGRKRSLEQRIAWAYWESAQMDLQWRYPYGHLLPLDPPPQFQVDAQALGPAATDPATRHLYWHRLQIVWNSPTTWQKDYEWDWSFASDSFSSGGQWLRDEVGRMFSSH